MELASDLETEQYGRKKLMEASTTHGQQVSLLNEQIEVLRTELAKHRQAGDGREREEEADGSTEISKSGQETVDGLLTEEDTLMKQSLKNVEAERDSLVHKLQTVLQEREDMGQQIQQLASEKDTLTEQLHSFSLHEEANESHDNHVTQDQILELSSNFTALQVPNNILKVIYIHNESFYSNYFVWKVTYSYVFEYSSRHKFPLIVFA